MTTSSGDASNSPTRTARAPRDPSKNVPAPPTFSDAFEHRAFLKFRLAQAYRIFGECRLCCTFAHHVFGTLGVPLDAITQDSCALYEDHVLFSDFRGVIDCLEEGVAIAAGFQEGLQMHRLHMLVLAIEYFRLLSSRAMAQLLPPSRLNLPFTFSSLRRIAVRFK
ncbi:uncharacterized protein EDB91DRAFT_1173236 [Suillus paluster]|uniref:uncharacterized protein n=1 Tax=Suillus paluster TaxID=48578 RepID=UPI001B87C9FB|nr:uncharacterized protein EDB91DRAFT_1173236 [Suillus paluster]KAG1723171.1 hypothetical protein EDB91DRAFT_1173236 [Suillus paluster]